MKTIISLIITITLLSAPSVSRSQIRFNQLPDTIIREADKKCLVIQEITDRGDTIYIYQPEEIEPVVSQPDSPFPIEVPANLTRSAFSSSASSLSHIPNSVTVDKNKDTGEIPIQSSVSNGNIVYTVPIESYMNTLNISLSYSSMSSNGIAGMGWNIGGLSSISIAHSNYYYDGIAAQPAKRDKTSAYTLDGVRLIKTSEDASKITYQSEQGFTKVLNYAPSGKYYFEVFYPDGRKATYGYQASTSARILYPMTRIEDNEGNFTDYAYFYSSAYNTYNISEIKYGKNNNVAASVKFLYKTRNDASGGYVAGLEMKQDQILYQVDTYYLSSLQRSYSLTHEFKDVNLLTKINCKAGGREFNPLLFYYGEDKVATSFASDLVILERFQSKHPSYETIYQRGKFESPLSSDGLMSYINYPVYDYTASDSKGNLRYGSRFPIDGKLYLYKNLADFALEPQIILAGDGFQGMYAADIDGDGKDEIVKINYIWESDMGKVTVTTYDSKMTASTKSFLIEGTFAEGSLKSPLPRYYILGDFTGDGKTKLLTIYGNKAPNIGKNQPLANSRATLIDLETKTVIQEMLIPPIDYFKESVFAVDHNGDGRSDLCVVGEYSTQIYEYSNKAFTQIASTAILNAPMLKNEHKKELIIGDINGDAKIDFLLSPSLDDYIYTTEYYACGYCDMCVLYRDEITDPRYFDLCQNFEHTSKTINYNTYRKWTSLLSTGVGFQSSTFDFMSVNTPEGYHITHLDPYFKFDRQLFTLLDMNGDNLPDLVYRSASDVITVYLNKNGIISTTAEPAQYTGAGKLVAANAASPNWGIRPNQLLSIIGGHVKTVSFTRDDGKQRMLSGVINSLGVVTKHYYRKLSDYTPSWKLSAEVKYPDSHTILDTGVASNTEVYLNGQQINSIAYDYENPIVNRQGLGLRGFTKTIQTDVIRSQSVSQTFDPINFGVLKSVDSPVSSASYNYTFTVASNKTALVTVSNKTEKDKLKDISVTSTYTYDAYGNPTKEIKDYGGGLKTTTDKKYNNLTGTPYILGQVSEESVTNERSGTSASVKAVLVYNTKGQITSKKNYYGANQTAEESFTYDANNNLTEAKSKSYTSAGWLVKKYSYDTYGRITTETDPLGFSTTYGYDTKGQVNSVKNHKAHETKYEYDVWGRKTKTTYADGSVETSSMAWASSPAGALILSTTTATGQPATQLYVDALGREVRKGVMRFDGKYLYTDNVYDSKGRVQKTSLPFKGAAATQWNTPAYDSYDRIVSLTYASGKKDSYAYDKNKVTATIDNVAKTTTYDATGKVISVSDPAGTITYNLRADGQPSSIVAPGSITTGFEYDIYGRQTKLIDPSAGTSVTAYNAAGNISQQTDANGKVTKLAYDTYNRMTTKEVVGELTTTYTYNTDGQLQSVSGNNSTSVAYTYDNLMRVATEKESVVDGKWLQKAFTYANGVTSAVVYSSNTGSIATENYVYTNGNMSEIKLNNTTSIWKLTQENDLGMATGATTGALTRTYGYDAYGLPTARVIKNGATAIQNFSYNFTATTGNLNWRKDNNRNIQENFTYDNLNRLTGFGGKTITYDVKGNITDFTTVGEFSYKNTSKPYAVTEISPYGKEIVLRDQTITYNGMMRPSSITEDIYRADFIYNTDGDRVRMQIKKNNAVDLTRYYIGGQYEFETGVAGTKEKLYLGGDAYSAAAVYVKEGTGAWQIYYIGRDYLGSITHIIDAAGAVKQELSYDAWGRLRNPVNQQLYAIGSEPALFLARGYTGHEHLLMFGLINMNARLYDPVIGRFLSPDPYVQAPYDSQNFNRFSYALNNPLRFNDPSGKIAFAPILIGMAIGAAIGAGTAVVTYSLATAMTNSDWNWNNFGKSVLTGGVIGAVSGGVFTVMAMISPTFTVAGTSFGGNVSVYLAKAGYAALTGAVSAGAGMLAGDFVDDGRIDNTFGSYAKGMGIAALAAGVISFGKSIYDYRTWDRLTIDDKIKELRKEFNYEYEIIYKADADFKGSYTSGSHLIKLGPDALTSRNLARWEMAHEMDHYYYDISDPATTPTELGERMRRRGGYLEQTRVSEGRAYNYQLSTGSKYNVNFREWNMVVSDARGWIEKGKYYIDSSLFGKWDYKMIIRNIF